MTALSVIYMGTPDFAVPSLVAIHRAGHRLLHVVTQPDRPRGRGRRVTPSPVKQAAIDLGCTSILQPKSVRSDPGFLERMEAAAPDVIVVAAFGQILPKRLLDIPRLGAINVHASLLPKYRGPAPIHWAIINREPVTGVTTMQMNEGLDTGDILLVSETPIRPDDTAATLHDRLADIGAELILETLSKAGAGALSPLPQDHANASHAPMLKKSDGRIRWDQPPAAIDAFVRGMTPWPGAFTHLDGRMIKIHRVAPALLDRPEPPGTVVAGFIDEIRVAVDKGAISILELQGESGRRLPASDFLRGYPVPAGKRFD